MRVGTRDRQFDRLVTMRYIKKPKRHIGSFTFVRDDREKQPWKLAYPCEVKRLPVGDYSFKGMEKNSRQQAEIGRAHV